MNRLLLYGLFQVLLILNSQAQSLIDAWVINNNRSQILVEQSGSSLSSEFFNVTTDESKFWTYKNDCLGMYLSTDLNVVVDHNQNNQILLDTIFNSSFSSYDCNNGSFFQYPGADSVFVIIRESNCRFNTGAHKSILSYFIFKIPNSPNSNAIVLKDKTFLDSILKNSIVTIPHKNEIDQWVISSNDDGLCKIKRFGPNEFDSGFFEVLISIDRIGSDSKLFPSENGEHIFYQKREQGISSIGIANFNRESGTLKEIKTIERSLLDTVVPNNSLESIIFLDSVHILYYTLLGDNGIVQIQFDEDFNILGRHKIYDISHIETGFGYLYHDELRLGGDEKIYVGNWKGIELNNQFTDSIYRHLSIIEKPYLFGPTCSFKPLSFGIENKDLTNGKDKLPAKFQFKGIQDNLEISGHCTGDSMSLYPIVSDCSEFNKWQIKFPDGAESTTNELYPKIYLSDTGIYEIKLISNTDTVIVQKEIFSNADWSLEIDTSICEGENIQLGYEEGNPQMVYTWQNDEHFSSQLVDEAGEYILSVKGPCRTGKIIYNVSIDKTELSSDNLRTDYCEEGRVSIEIPENGTQFQWLDERIDYKNITESGSYPVRFFNQCLDTVINYHIEITEDIIKEGINVFTPNGDGYNDLFKPYSENINPEGFSLTIYNRWGSKVFETSDPEEYWDGGQSVSGSYFYQLQYSDCFELGKFHKGFVELLR